MLTVKLKMLMLWTCFFCYFFFLIEKLFNFHLLQSQFLDLNPAHKSGLKIKKQLQRTYCPFTEKDLEFNDLEENKVWLF